MVFLLFKLLQTYFFILDKIFFPQLSLFVIFVKFAPGLYLIHFIESTSFESLESFKSIVEMSY